MQIHSLHTSYVKLKCLLQLVLLWGALWIGDGAMAQDYKSLLIELGQTPKKDRSRLLLGYLHENILPETQLDSLVDQAYLLARSQSDQLLIDQLDYLQAKRAIINAPDNSYKKQRQAFERLLHKYQNNGKKLLKGQVYQDLGQLQFEHGDHAESFTSSYKAYDIYKEVGLYKSPEIGRLLHELSLNYIVFRDYQQIIELMYQSVKLPKYNNNLDIQRYNNLAWAHFRLKNLDSATFYLRIANTLASNYSYSIWEGIIAGNLGEIQYSLHQYQQAYQSFYKQYNYYQNTEAELEKLSSYINMARVLTVLDSVDVAKIYFDKFRFLVQDFKPKFYAQNISTNRIKQKYYEAYKLYLQKTGNYNLAIKYSDSAYTLRREMDQLFNKYKVQIIRDQIKLHDSELELSAQNNKQMLSQIYFTLILLVVIGGVSSVYLYLNWVKTKRKQLYEQLLYQNQISKLQQQELSQQLLNSKQELNNYLERMEAQKQNVMNLQARLRSYFDPTNKGKLMVELHENYRNPWQDIREKFRLSDPEVYELLLGEKSLFTSAQAKILVLLYLGYSNKEIAKLLSITEVAVRVNWNRIRKKLNITQTMSPKALVEHLLNKGEG